MSGVIMLLVFIAILFAVSFIIYYLIYNKRINERLKNKESLAHNSMVSVDTVGKFWLVFFGVVVVFIIFGELNSLKSDIEAQQVSLSNQISDMEIKLSEMEEMIAKQNSLVNQFECIVGKVDAEQGTVEVKFTCVPKMYSDDTKITLINGDKNIEFENKGNGKFISEQTFSIFECFDEKTIILQDDAGIIRTCEELNILGDCLAIDCLPTLSYYNFSTVFTHWNGSVKISGENMPNDLTGNFNNIELYLVKNSERIKDLNTMDESFSVKITADDKDSIMLVVSGIDQYGYLHKHIITGVNIDDDIMGKGDSIYNVDGVLLYGAEIE